MLHFVELPAPGKKTKVWKVSPVTDGTKRLGLIKWYSPWRRYCFFPDPGTLFDRLCLEGVTLFLDKAMDDWRLARLKAKR